MAVVGLAGPAWADTPRSTAAALEEQCKAMSGVDFSEIQDAPTQLTAAKLQEGKSAIPEYCQIEGYVAPQVNFVLGLPVSNWNGKFLAIGSWGTGGVIEDDACDAALRRGYACIVSDTGHKGTGSDGLWARNNLPAQVDFAYRAVHVMTLAGKVLTERYYTRGPRKSYFMGCSTGGYEALVEAQRFPWDFDGIIAGAPDMDEVDLMLRESWNVRIFFDAHSGKPILTSEELQLLHQTVLDACDMDDGVKDGIVGNPVSCKVNLSQLACTAGKKHGCLSSSQLAATERMYAGPTNSKGERISSRGVLPGSELGWNDDFLGFAAGAAFADSELGHMVYGASAGWTAARFDFDRDYQRVGLGALYANTNPDLRKFKAAGGKLIVYQGSNDAVEVPGAIVDYYETVEKTMGGRIPTQDFFRFFMVPGMNHCGAGAGAYGVDYLGHLEAWVERGKTPDVITGAHIDDAYLASMPLHRDIPGMTPEAKLLAAAISLEFPLDPAIPISFTRPIYPYPRYAKYKGAGDPKEAASFGPVEPRGADHRRTYLPTGKLPSIMVAHEEGDKP
jgi:feruloyl esterase